MDFEFKYESFHLTNGYEAQFFTVQVQSVEYVESCGDEFVYLRRCYNTTIDAVYDQNNNKVDFKSFPLDEQKKIQDLADEKAPDEWVDYE